MGQVTGGVKTRLGQPSAKRARVREPPSRGACRRPRPGGDLQQRIENNALLLVRWHPRARGRTLHGLSTAGHTALGAPTDRGPQQAPRARRGPAVDNPSATPARVRLLPDTAACESSGGFQGAQPLG